MASKKHQLTRVAERIWEDVDRNAEKIAGSILGDQGGPDGESQRRSDYLQYVADNWHDEEFRADVFLRLVPTFQGPGGGEVPALYGVESAEALLKDLAGMGVRAPPPMPVAPPAVPVVDPAMGAI